MVLYDEEIPQSYTVEFLIAITLGIQRKCPLGNRPGELTAADLYYRSYYLHYSTVSEPEVNNCS